MSQIRVDHGELAQAAQKIGNLAARQSQLAAETAQGADSAFETADQHMSNLSRASGTSSSNSAFLRPQPTRILVFTATLLVALSISACGSAATEVTSTDTRPPSPTEGATAASSARLQETATTREASPASTTPTRAPIPIPTTVPFLTPEPVPIIAFSSAREGQLDLFAMNQDGTCVYQVTNDPSDETRPSYSAQTRKIALVSNRSGNDDIFLIESLGFFFDMIQLTSDQANDYDPALSPDGSTLAFISDRGGQEDLYLLDLVSLSETPLTNDTASDSSPSWSPDGKHIAFSSSRTGSGDIYLIDPDGANPVQLTDSPANDAAPAWSPDGKQITFMSQRDGNWDIYAMGSDGSDPRRLTDHPAADQYPAWAGEQIAFMSARTGDFEVFVMNADGSLPTRLTSNPGMDGFPIWPTNLSPDRITPTATPLAVEFGPELIAFESNREGGEYDTNIFVMNPDGSEVTRITYLRNDVFENCPPAPAGDPDWSPASRRLAFWADLTSFRRIYVMNPDGSGFAKLTDPHDTMDQSKSPSWSPDGRRIAFLRINKSGTFIYVVDVNTAEEQLLVSDFGYDPGMQPSWSPDGQQLAYSRSGVINLFDLVSEKETPLIGGVEPAWSPDGKAIAYVRNGVIYGVNVDRSEPLRVTEGGAPTWSPDGLRLAFEREVEGQYDIFVIGIDGTGLVQLTFDPADDRNPDWK